VKKDMIRPGAVAEAIILPRANSEPVSLNTSQLTAIRLNPNPINEVILPKKNRRNVGFFRIDSNLL
tara:strand:+ start:52 stop:249 length:198 start_codon:yes stop_codon:yes gene_type:complete